MTARGPQPQPSDRAGSLLPALFVALTTAALTALLMLWLFGPPQSQRPPPDQDAAAWLRDLLAENRLRAVTTFE